MAHEIQFIADNGVWMHEVPPEDPETMSDGTLLPPIQRHGDTVSRDAPDGEISNAWSPLMSFSAMAFGVGDRFSHIPDYSEGEEGKLYSKSMITVSLSLHVTLDHVMEAQSGPFWW